MARKGENIYKRKDGRYEGRYVKYYEANGKPHWGYVYDRSYSVVKSKLSEKKANNRLFSTAVPTNLLLYEWIEMWIDAQRQIKLSTKTMYHSHLKNHIQGSIGNVMLKKLNSAMIQRFIDDESEKHSAKTVHTVFSMLRLALKAANDKGYIGKIYVDVRLPKIQKKAIRILSPQEQKRLEKVILECNNRYDIGILLSLYTGLIEQLDAYDKNQKEQMTKFLCTFDKSIMSGDNCDAAIYAIIDFANETGIALQHTDFNDFSNAMLSSDTFVL